MSAALAIQNLEREHLGFLLTHFDAESEGDGVSEGDCVFEILPMRADLFKSPLAVLLFRYHFRESGEHKVRLTKTGGVFVYEITPRLELPLKIKLESTGEGRIWQYPDLSTPIAYVVSTVGKV